MPGIRIQRTESDRFGTFGVLTLGGFRCFTLELPWHDNAPQISCIPTGEYEVEPWSSKKYAQALHVREAPGRTGILIHQGNWAGERAQGLYCNSTGCILVGSSRAIIKEQPGIVNSVITLSRLCGLITGRVSLEVSHV
jgi:hypothetical protein